MHLLDRLDMQINRYSLVLIMVHRQSEMILMELSMMFLFTIERFLLLKLPVFTISALYLQLLQLRRSQPEALAEGKSLSRGLPFLAPLHTNFIVTEEPQTFYPQAIQVLHSPILLLRQQVILIKLLQVTE